MYNQPSYQVAYANFVMDQHQDIPTKSQKTSSLVQSNSVLQPQQNKVMEFKKPVRTRISFSHSQQVILESEFRGSAYIYRSRRMEIANRLGIEEKHVKVWFQNRRMKWKRETMQNGNKVTLRKPIQFPVTAELRKVQEENAGKEIPLPVHKPMAAQLVKGVCLNAPKVFKPQLIVQMPVPVTEPSKRQIYQTTNPVSIEHHLRQQPTRQQPRQIHNNVQEQLPQQPLLHQVQQILQQALDVQHKLQQHQPSLEAQHNINPTLLTIIPKDTFTDRLQNPECSEESVDLDRYLNDLEQQVEALKSKREEEQNQQQQQQLQRIQQNLADCVEKPDGLSNANMEFTDLRPKMGDDFDVKDFLDDLDRYVSYPQTAPELDFDESLFGQGVDFDNCPLLEYDPTIPLVDFSFDDWTLVD